MNRTSKLCDFTFVSCNSLYGAVNIRFSSIDKENMKSHKILYSKLMHVYKCTFARVSSIEMVFILNWRKYQYLHWVICQCTCIHHPFAIIVRFQNTFQNKKKKNNVELYTCVPIEKCWVDLFKYITVPKWCIALFGFDTYTIRITYRTAALVSINFNVDTFLRRWA